jgi:hypothetical protein
MSDITPGIWTVYEEGAEDGAQVWAREDGPAPKRQHVASRIGDADARLIAAAPELLEACQAVAADLEQLLDGDDFSGMSDDELFAGFLRVLRPAIAKAEGRSE